MVKTINITLEESEHKDLAKKKGDKTWKECLIAGAEK